MGSHLRFSFPERDVCDNAPQGYRHCSDCNPNAICPCGVKLKPNRRVSNESELVAFVDKFYTISFLNLIFTSYKPTLIILVFMRFCSFQ